MITHFLSGRSLDFDEYSFVHAGFLKQSFYKRFQFSNFKVGAWLLMFKRGAKKKKDYF